MIRRAAFLGVVGLASLATNIQAQNRIVTEVDARPGVIVPRVGNPIPAVRSNDRPAANAVFATQRIPSNQVVYPTRDLFVPGHTRASFYTAPAAPIVPTVVSRGEDAAIDNGEVIVIKQRATSAAPARNVPVNTIRIGLLDRESVQNLRDNLARDLMAAMATLDGFKANFSADRGVLEAQRNRLPASHQYLIEDAKAALERGDSVKLASLMDQMRSVANPQYNDKNFAQWRDVLASQVQTRVEIDRLRGIVDSNGTSSEVSTAADQLRKIVDQDQNFLNLSPSQADSLKNAAKSVATNARGLKFIDEQVAGARPTGNGMLTILSIPTMPGMSAGDAYLIGSCGMVVVDANTPELVISHASATDVIGASVVLANPAPDATNGIDENMVVLENPSYATSSVRFTTDGNFVELQPGQQVHLNPTVVEFDRGGGFGMARNTLDPGAYYFKVTPKGWEIYGRAYRATVDNAGNRFDFNFMINGQPQVDRSGDKKTFECDRPMEVVFDRGDGELARRKLEYGSYWVAVDARTGLLDLFDASSVPMNVAAESSPLKPVTHRVRATIPAPAPAP